MRVPERPGARHCSLRSRCSLELRFLSDSVLIVTATRPSVSPSSRTSYIHIYQDSGGFLLEIRAFYALAKLTRSRADPRVNRYARSSGSREFRGPPDKRREGEEQQRKMLGFIAASRSSVQTRECNKDLASLYTYKRACMCKSRKRWKPWEPLSRTKISGRQF